MKKRQMIGEKMARQSSCNKGTKWFIVNEKRNIQ